MNPKNSFSCRGLNQHGRQSLVNKGGQGGRQGESKEDGKEEIMNRKKEIQKASKERETRRQQETKKERKKEGKKERKEGRKERKKGRKEERKKGRKEERKKGRKDMRVIEAEREKGKQTLQPHRPLLSSRKPRRLGYAGDCGVLVRTSMMSKSGYVKAQMIGV